ncbi:transglutaminase domain-containing protein [Candidatus Woesearchaeota archaeon]|nr:transglutaminase domain-containing protein [Candidatus Woesearchaeota archaeon]
MRADDLDDDGEEGKQGLVRRILILIIAAFLILLLVSWIIPWDGIRLDPEPKGIPRLADLYLGNITLSDTETPLVSRSAILDFVSTGLVIKRAADQIVARSCDYHGEFAEACYAKALFYFVRDSMQYIPDPPDEYVKTAEESLLVGGGDCEDASILLASLLESVGVSARFVYVPQHVYVQAHLPAAVKKYKAPDQGDWVSLDATCEYCRFGEIPYRYSDVRKQYVGVY